jgi:hypothetical protein
MANTATGTDPVSLAADSVSAPPSGPPGLNTDHVDPGIPFDQQAAC